jgi:hypothetical protein
MVHPFQILGRKRRRRRRTQKSMTITRRWKGSFVFYPSHDDLNKKGA